MDVQAPRRRVAKAPEARRQDLLDAARRVFAAKGIPATTISDITEAAGVAKGTFYLYFDSKEALLGALKERFVDELVAHAAELYGQIGTGDWWALADTTVESMIDFMLAHRDLIQVFAQEGLAPESQSIFLEAETKLRDMFGAGIRLGMEVGAFKVSDPHLTAMFLAHGTRGVVEHAIIYGMPLDRDHVVAVCKEMMRKALAP